MAYIPYIHINKFIDIIRTIMPYEVYEIISYIINSTIENRNFNNVILSFVLAMWSSSRAVSSITKTMNTYYQVDETRSPVSILLRCFIFTLILFALIFSSLILLVYGELIGSFIFDYIGLDEVFIVLWNYLRYGLTLITVVVAFLILFMYTPNKTIKIIECLPGAIVTTMSWILISVIYSYYTSNYASYEVIYGSLSSIIILISWIYLSSFSILIGCEINSFLYFKKV